MQSYQLTLTNQPVSWSSIKRVARTASTGDWARVLARSEQTPNLPPATSTDAAILAAKNAVSSLDTDLIDPTNTAEWSALQNGLSALQAEGDMAASTVAAINALPTVVTTPLANVQLYDLQYAQADGLIPANVPVE